MNLPKQNIPDLLQTAENLPAHIAIIMDGNGRWAKQRGYPRLAGHKEGVRSVREIVETAGNLGIRFLTLYTFSKENWSRPKSEVTGLMHLLVRTIEKEIVELMKNNVRLRVIGRLQELPTAPRKSVENAIAKTSANTGLQLNLALSYGSRQEIVDAVRKIQLENIDPSDIDISIFEKFLYTSEIPEPDLLIRTGGEKRISNFLLWQIAYSEIVFSDVYWPEFRTNKLYEAIEDYLKRERRFGKIDT